MKASDLIGKKAIRADFVKYPGGVTSTSFTTNPIKILYANETHIIYEFTEEEPLLNDGKASVLNKIYCDDKWIDYDELMSKAVSNHE